MRADKYVEFMLSWLILKIFYNSFHHLERYHNSQLYPVFLESTNDNFEQHIQSIALFRLDQHQLLHRSELQSRKNQSKLPKPFTSYQLIFGDLRSYIWFKALHVCRL